MDFASRNRASMRNVNPPGYNPPGHAGHVHEPVPNPPGYTLYGPGDQYGVGVGKFGAPTIIPSPQPYWQTRGLTPATALAHMRAASVNPPRTACFNWQHGFSESVRRDAVAGLLRDYPSPFTRTEAGLGQTPEWRERADEFVAVINSYCAGVKSAGAVDDTTPATIAPDGRVAGIDGMLDQVTESLVRQVSADHDLQVRVGTAAGVAIGKTVLTGMFFGWVANVVWNALPER